MKRFRRLRSQAFFLTVEKLARSHDPERPDERQARQRKQNGDDVDLPARQRISTVRGEPIQNRTGLSTRQNEDEDADPDKAARQSLGQPFGIDLGKERIEPDADTDRCEARSYPTSISALVRHDRTVFRPIGAVLGKFLLLLFLSHAGATPSFLCPLNQET